MGGAVPPFPVLRLIKKSAFVTRPKLLDYVGKRDELLMRAEEIFGWLKSGELTVSIDKTSTCRTLSRGTSTSRRARARASASTRSELRRHRNCGWGTWAVHAWRRFASPPFVYKVLWALPTHGMPCRES